ncbi:MAG: segregation/condensation protein A [Desulfuromonas sp.]|nr:MAG: segregation/condensation protein A [Desulfuromonas sp.]
MAFEIQLENFSGPMDLLLHLIKSNEMDVYDIRIVEITEQYLQVIEQMKLLDLDIAGEFLLMASTLLHIKSRMLLPVSEEIEEEEGEDPRAELVKRLLEYQRYKEVAELFQQLPQLDRDVFSNCLTAAELISGEELEDAQIVASVYQLAEALRVLIKERPPEVFHEVIQESLSVAVYIERILEKLTSARRLALRDFFSERLSRSEIVVTFLAMLELVKMRMVNVEQVKEFSDIWLSLAVPVEELSASTSEESLGYG